MALADRPALAGNAEWTALLNDAIDKLESLYQSIGVRTTNEVVDA
jgi:hypothetical protein